MSLADAVEEPVHMRKRVFHESRELRKHILLKAYKRAMRPGSNFTLYHLRDLHDELAKRAALLKIPDEHKWLVKLTNAFEAAMGSGVPSHKVEIYNITTAIFDDNRSEFLESDVEQANLSVRKISVSTQPPLSKGGKPVLN